LQEEYRREQQATNKELTIVAFKLLQQQHQYHGHWVKLPLVSPRMHPLTPTIMTPELNPPPVESSATWVKDMSVSK
jgi:hypothetical protein